jgi:4-alpha-glucanotransferase
MKVPGLHERASGVLLHPTSLPGPHGSGDLGAEARRFARWLHAAGQRWWQMLPVAPVGYGNSPYSALSAFAGSPLLVSLEGLVEDGLLPAAGLAGAPRFPRDRVDFAAASAFRGRHLRRAFAAFASRPGRRRRAFEAFCARNASWLDDFALYAALKEHQGLRAWTEWPEDLRRRERPVLRSVRRTLASELEFHRFCQWIFDRQWRALRMACRALGIALLGDVPLFVAHDSADVWAHPELWKLDARGRPTVVAGVPPDYFSETGQRWGNPLYRWDRMAGDGYRWWVDRLRITLERFDAVRLDHFIGFLRAWEIPASEPTAVRGRYVRGPGDALFDALEAALGAPLPLVAEDLGVVTPEVKALRDRYGLPGLRVLQFAFGTDVSAPDFLPHNYPRRTVVYTGTHDNDTTVGWFRDEGGGTRTRAQIERERRAALDYVGGPPEAIHWSLIRAALLSVADLAVVPAQDLLGLGSAARMNRPGEPRGNWEWRLIAGSLGAALARRLAHLTRLSGRMPEATSRPPARRPRARRA